MLIENCEGKSPLSRSRHGWEDKIRIILGKKCGKVWTGCIWLRIQTSNWPLWAQ